MDTLGNQLKLSDSIKHTFNTWKQEVNDDYAFLMIYCHFIGLGTSYKGAYTQALGAFQLFKEFQRNNKVNNNV